VIAVSGLEPEPTPPERAVTDGAPVDRATLGLAAAPALDPAVVPALDPQLAPALVGDAQLGVPVVDIVLPVFNEAHVLATSVARLGRHLDDSFPYPWRITIVDNASTDATWAEAREISTGRSDVHAVHLPEQGRGRALRAAWTASPSPVLVYMDIDLSTGLEALAPLVASVVTGHSDIAVGSRRVPGARVRRSTKRAVISVAYNTLLRVTLGLRVRDAQCGFKAISRSAAEALLPDVEDDAWFFDTELLALAERRGLRVVELPVNWVEDPDSRVRLWSTALGDLRGIVRLLRPSRSRRS
jgi:glycosyltransferase involved in cell wall biosynthesis